MRTEVKVAFLIAAVAAVICIVFFVNQSRKTASSVSDVVHFDAPADSPATADRPTPGDRRTAAADRRAARDENTRQTPTPSRQPGASRQTPGRTAARQQPGTQARTPSAQPQPSPAEKPTAASSAQPESARLAGDTAADTRTPSADDLRERIRQLAGLDEQAGQKPDADPDTAAAATDRQGPTVGSQPPADRPEQSAATAPPRQQPAQPTPREAASPAVSPPGRRDDTARPGSQSSSLPGFRPTTPGTRQHTIAQGETLWEIAEYYYKDGSLHHRILEANPGLDPARLKIGQVISIPPQDRPESTRQRHSEQTTSGAGRHTYVVEHGDSLIKIARNLLRDGARWQEIYELNRDKIPNPDILTVGTELKLPER